MSAHPREKSIHLILIGDELLNGNIADLNGKWLGRYLNSKGHSLASIDIIPDRPSTIALCLEKYLVSPGPSIVILSGGLGPTKDDRTKNAVADYFSKPLEERADLIETLKTRYEKRQKSWNPATNHYHLFPKDMTPLENPSGLAPGIFYEQTQKAVICAPGVPHEFESMLMEFFENQRTDLLSSEEAIYSLQIRTRFLPEEDIFGKIAPNLWNQLERWGKVSSLPRAFGVDIMVELKNQNHLFEDEIEEIKAYLKETPLNPYIWHIGPESLPEKIILEAKEKSIMIGLAESCTGGLAASFLTDVPGSSEVFLGSVVSYANEVKENILNVKTETLKKHGAVSSEVAAEMAKGGVKALKCDICLSFSGIAGPGGGSPKKPVGTVAIGIATSDEVHADIFYFSAKENRERLKRRFALRGLHQLLDQIRKY